MVPIDSDIASTCVVVNSTTPTQVVNFSTESPYVFLHVLVDDKLDWFLKCYNFTKWSFVNDFFNNDFLGIVSGVTQTQEITLKRDLEMSGGVNSTVFQFDVTRLGFV